MTDSHSIAHQSMELHAHLGQTSFPGRSGALDTTSALDDHPFKPIWRTIMNVGDWLRSLGLGQYDTTFRDNGIDADVLFELTEADFEKLGVLLGHRRRLTKAIATLKNAAGGPVQGQPAAEPAPKPQDAAERRQLTVMFCDLVGSTAMSARLDPEDMREIIGCLSQCCADLIERDGGVRRQVYGRRSARLFRLSASARARRRARGAGPGLRSSRPRRSLRPPHGAPLHVRVGIATGIVVVGDLLGSGEAQERGVVGNTPNLAARLQGIAELGQRRHRRGHAQASRQPVSNSAISDRKTSRASPRQTRAYAALRESAQESRFEALHAGGLIALSAARKRANSCCAAGPRRRRARARSCCSRARRASASRD